MILFTVNNVINLFSFFAVAHIYFALPITTDRTPAKNTSWPNMNNWGNSYGIKNNNENNRKHFEYSLVQKKRDINMNPNVFL